MARVRFAEPCLLSRQQPRGRLDFVHLVAARDMTRDMAHRFTVSLPRSFDRGHDGDLIITYMAAAWAEERETSVPFSANGAQQGRHTRNQHGAIALPEPPVGVIEGRMPVARIARAVQLTDAAQKFERHVFDGREAEVFAQRKAARMSGTFVVVTRIVRSHLVGRSRGRLF